MCKNLVIKFISTRRKKCIGNYNDLEIKKSYKYRFEGPQLKKLSLIQMKKRKWTVVLHRSMIWDSNPNKSHLSNLLQIEEKTFFILFDSFTVVAKIVRNTLKINFASTKFCFAQQVVTLRRPAHAQFASNDVKFQIPHRNSDVMHFAFDIF